jgi:hypothetical protein
MGAIGLHIGVPKTGSSAIQAFLRANGPSLREHGVGYSLHSEAISDVGGVPSGNARALLKYLDPRRRQRRFDLEAFEQAEFYDVYMSEPGRLALISSELLSAIDWRQLLRFREQILRGHSIVVVVFVRNLYDHALSTWNQRVKWHAYARSFKHFARSEYDNPQITTIQKYAKCFGWKRMRVVNYDGARQDIIPPFFQALGVAAPSAWRAPRVNRGLTRAELTVQRALNLVHRDARISKALAQRLVCLRPDAQAAKLRRPEVARFLSDRFRPDVEQLAEASGLDLTWVFESPRAWALGAG